MLFAARGGFSVPPKKQSVTCPPAGISCGRARFFAAISASALDRAGSHALDDIAGEEDVHKQNRQNRQQNEHIDLAKVKFRVIRRAQLRDHDGNRLHFRFIKEKRWQEVVVPRLDKREDELHRNGRLEHGEHNAVEGKELTGAIHARLWYCKKIDKSFVEKLNKRKPDTIEEIKMLWYNGNMSEEHTHYSETRYRALNLHSCFQHGHYEIRCCNASLHAGEIRSQIVLALAISNAAVTRKFCSPNVSNSDNMRYSFRVWLLNLGLIGDEFKNCRMALYS